MTRKSAIIILGEGSLARTLKHYYGAMEEFNILGCTAQIGEARAFAAGNKNLILIADMTGKDNAYFERLKESFSEGDICYLVICDTVKQGFDLLGKGASEMCLKPRSFAKIDITPFFTTITMKLRKISRTLGREEKVLKNKYSAAVNHIIAIGSSTGGTECILEIIRALPENAPPVLVVQHMPPVFTKLYSARLNGECRMSVWEAGNNDKLENGLVLVAPGDMHMSLYRMDNTYYVKCDKGAPYQGHIPSVDVLFSSVAAVAGSKGIGVILSGMGKDGADGLFKMRQRGAFTIGQDEESCVVYGMPKAAWELGAVAVQAKPEQIASIIMEQVYGGYSAT